MNSPEQPKRSISEITASLEDKGITREQIQEFLENAEAEREREAAASTGSASNDQPGKREVESLEAAFRDDLQDIFKDLPRVKAVLDRKERATLNLSPDENQEVSAKTLWLLSSWVGSLAAEVDRLHDELDALTGADSDSQGHD